jgi:cell division protein FtsI (penicillin-binding protein 3)
LLEYVRGFGFGEKTGVALPAESAGRVRLLEDWGRTSIGSVAMGHEISATSLQLARAAAVIANGGLLVRPRLILWSRRPDGPRDDTRVEPGVRVLRPETAITMRRMMEGVVLQGTGTRARLNGYSAGGKTGSAQIFDFETRRYSHRYNSSFVGFAPVTDPRIVVAVTLNGASRYGGVVSAPVFRTVAQTALRILGVAPDIIDPRAFPDAGAEDFSDLAVAGLGDIPASPAPEPGFEAAHSDAGEGGLTAAADQAPSPYVFGPRVPDFQGRTLRAVLDETSRMGVAVEYVGSGVVRAQYPAAGAVLPVGQKVLVEFAR